MNKREMGSYYENLACEHIVSSGGKILSRNFRCKRGEIDIIAKDGKYLVFVEVKYRTSTRYGTAEAAVDFRKQRVICRVSDYYIKRFGISSDYPIRYDVVTIAVDETSAIHIRWHKNAFSYILCKAW